jgi:tetratricopeptide (TPR) repeat protein
MKKYFFILVILLAATIVFAQPGKKPVPKEKPPTQKEMEEMMKEAQKAMEEMNPEDKKAMDSMGIKMPSFKEVPKVSDKQLATAWEIENLIVPKKDDARINAISKTPLTGGSIVSFISSVNSKTITLLRPESKTLSEKIYAQLKSTGKNSDAIGNTAAGLWIMGRLQPALYIMGKICAEDINNTDNLANYASMLSMSGVQQSAIPVLNYLNTKYPRNSTLLNNLGQAWFGLGDMMKAEKYLDSTLRLYAYHPQANLTKSFIEEEKGNKTEAVTLVKKSILHSYSQEKEERLRKLGHKLTSKDVSLPASQKKDALNLGGSVPPPFPKSVDECIAFAPEWARYRQQLQTQAASLKNQLEEAIKLAAEMQQKRINENMNMIKASMNAGSPQGVLTLVPLHAGPAYLKLNEVVEENGRKSGEVMKKAVKFYSESGVKLKDQYEKEIEKLSEEDLEQTGEGLPNKDFCPRYKEVSDKYLRAINVPMESFFKESLGLVKNLLNEVTHWHMYSEWPENFEVKKLQAKISWLDALEAESIFDFISITKYKCIKPLQGKAGKLSQFDDVACQYHSELSLFVGKMKMDCSRFTTELDLSVIKFGLKQDMDKETFADQFMSGSVEVGAKIGKDVKLGPLSVEASAGTRIGIEIDPTGVKDVYVTGGVKAGAGTNIIGEASEAAGTPSSMMGVGVSDVSIDGGIEGRISLVSGRGSIYGTGIFGK